MASSYSYGSNSGSRISSGISSGYKPSYAAAPSKYFTSSHVDLPSASLYSAYHSPVYTRVTGTKYFDRNYPTRHFGSRLGKGYLGIHVRPSLHGKYHKQAPVHSCSHLLPVSLRLYLCLVMYRRVLWYNLPA